MSRGAGITARELDVLSAWWLTGSVKAAASLLAMPEQSAKNHLHLARVRSGAASNVLLVQRYLFDLRSLAELRRTQHKRARRAVA